MAITVERKGGKVLRLYREKDSRKLFHFEDAEGNLIENLSAIGKEDRENLNRIEFKGAFTDNTTYDGEDAVEYYSDIILSSPTVKKCRTLLNVKNKRRLPRFVWGDVLQDDDCTFSEGNGPTLSQREIEVVGMKINESICVKDLEANFISERMAAGANGVDFIPTDEGDYLVMRLIAQAGRDLERIVINGDTTLSGSVSLFDGIRKLASTDAAVVHGDSTGVTLAVANIVDKLTDIYLNMPDEISAGIPDINGNIVTGCIWMSPKAAKMYKIANASDADKKYIFPMPGGELNFMGIPIVESHALTIGAGTGAPTKEEMFATDPENIWFGTDLESDFEDILILPQKDKTGEPTVRMVGRMKGGVQYAIPEYLVYWWDVTGVTADF